MMEKWEGPAADGWLRMHPVARDRNFPEIAATLQNGSEASEDLNDSVHRYRHETETRRRLRDLASP